MGETNIIVSKKKGDYLQFITALLHDMEALEIMVNNNHFEADIQRIGAEQELCIVNTEWKPADNSLEILSMLNDSSAYTTELAKFNIEINLLPIELKTGCFTILEADLLAKMERAHEVAESFKSKLVLAGILPTISRNEITLDYLTPLERYFQLSKKLRNLRGRKFDLYLKGVDELHIRHDSIMFEACNTSFQTHLQINPKDFVSAYNWASAIAAPVLAATSNSPLLLGKELWSEIRIALFQQSIDTRHSMDEIREQSPRVSFGKDWVYNSITEIYQEDISRFEVLMPDTIDDNALENLKNNITPSLRALRLHNGTVYRWNRMCYGITDNKPHLRIENRYLPAGPTIRDEIANMAFWIGLMKGMPENAKTIWEHFDFKDVKANFFKAARTGIESVFNWRDKEISARDLILNELLPLAAEGLKKSGISDEEIFLYLGVIEKRIKTHTGAQWQIKNYRKLRKEMNTTDALKVLTESMYNYQRKNTPVYAWESIDIATSVKEQIGNMTLIKQLMSPEVFTVYPDDPVSLVKHIMLWNKINHVVIENKKGKILGIITAGHLKDLGENQSGGDSIPVKKLMRKEILTIAPEDKIEDALKIMQENWISSLPVVQDNELIGMITKTDMLRWLALKQV